MKKVETEQSDRIIIQDDNGKQVAEMTIEEDEYLEEHFSQESNEFYSIPDVDIAQKIFEFLLEKQK